MILFTILAIIMLLLIGFVILVTAIGGFIFTFLFSDVIVCIFIIGLILYKIIKRKRR